MGEQEEEIVPYADYEDMLEPGYAFSPTDSEIIVYYLKPMIETGQHPECRLYQVYIYDHTPDELAERYRPCKNKWYFLTPRERKYENGDRPNRITKDSGRWKMTQSCAVVCDDVSGLQVGKKNRFAYYVDSDRKTPWLMHEYTTMDPNLPKGSGQQGKKLTEWVICKIYKKEKKQSAGNKRAPIRNQEEGNVEQNRCLDEPSPIRPRLPINPSVNQPNEEPVNAQMQETDHSSGTSAPIVAPITTIFMGSAQTRTNTVTRVNTFQDLFSTQPLPITHPTGSCGPNV